MLAMHATSFKMTVREAAFKQSFFAVFGTCFFDLLML